MKCQDKERVTDRFDEMARDYCERTHPGTSMQVLAALLRQTDQDATERALLACEEEAQRVRALAFKTEELGLHVTEQSNTRCGAALFAVNGVYRRIREAAERLREHKQPRLSPERHGPTS